MGLKEKWLADMKRDAIAEFLSKPMAELTAEIEPILADVSTNHLLHLKNLIDLEIITKRQEFGKAPYKAAPVDQCTCGLSNARVR